MYNMSYDYSGTQYHGSPYNHKNWSSCYYCVGSLKCQIIDGDGTLVDEFVAIAGELDTDKLLSGDYINQTVIEIFNRVKKINNFYFALTKYNLVAFLISVGLAQKIRDNVIRLSEEVSSGVLPIDEFNKIIKVNMDTFASEVAAKYPLLVEKIEKSFADNIHILEQNN